MSHDCIQLIYLESEVMSDDEKRVETTSEDWLAFSQTIEQFSKNLDANELVLLKALITQAGAELELLASEVGEEDMHRFQENLRPGVNFMNIRALAANYKTSFAEVIPGAFDFRETTPSADGSTSIIWLE
jgi:hypothetical protein